jgi:hypothetical protein
MDFERPDLPARLQRLAAAMLRLFGERLDQARASLKEDMERVAALAAAMLVGALAAVMGLAMIAIAATELLAPWVQSRPARLILVGGPLALAGALRTRAIGRRLARERLRVRDAADALREDASLLADLEVPLTDEEDGIGGV